MGSCTSKVGEVNESEQRSPRHSLESIEDATSERRSQFLASEMFNNILNELDRNELDSTSETSAFNTDFNAKRLSEIAERLFLQDLKTYQTCAVEMGNEKPIELESEARRRMQKHRASITQATSGLGGNLKQRRSVAAGMPVDISIFVPKEPEHLLHKLPIISEEEMANNKQSSSSQIEATTVQTLSSMPTDSAELCERYAEAIPFQRVFVSGESEDFALMEIHDSCLSMIHALRTRLYYMRLAKQNFPNLVAKFTAQATNNKLKPPIYPDYGNPMEKLHLPQDEKHWQVTTRKGVVTVFDSAADKEVRLPDMKREKFITNRNLLYALVADGPLKSFCYRRLSYLKNKFGIHRLLNEELELEMMKNPDRSCRRDFYNVRKVDTHIHAAACMSQKHLLGFMQEKVKKEPNRVVLRKEGRKMTLREWIVMLSVLAVVDHGRYHLNTPIVGHVNKVLQKVFEYLQLDPLHLNVDSLDVHADRQTFHRFDRFNNLYSPMGASELREIFLKTNNDINGDYFAEIIGQIEQSLIEQKYHLLELRLSIYGKSDDEWQNLAHWFCSHKLESTHIRWLIQVPRLYDMYKSKEAVKNFEHILDNVFRPVMEATIKPEKHREISLFLRHVVGFDSVDDESKQEDGFMKQASPTPDEWTRDTNPSYTYYIFYMYANVMRINHLRHLRGMNTFALRPHCGEAGNLDHLLTAFLLAENISHGLVLKKVPVLQYLYYLAQIGICMSPLSNNHLFLEYNKSPFPDYFARGLNVCLSTDDPLQFHFTMEPLMEEYAVAAQVWKLSVCDMCELARTSVQVSGFSDDEKQRWLGEDYRKDGAEGNDISKTNVPDIRVAFREETLTEELRLLSADYQNLPWAVGDFANKNSSQHVGIESTFAQNAADAKK